MRKKKSMKQQQIWEADQRCVVFSRVIAEDIYTRRGSEKPTGWCDQLFFFVGWHKSVRIGKTILIRESFNSSRFHDHTYYSWEVLLLLLLSMLTRRRYSMQHLPGLCPMTLTNLFKSPSFMQCYWLQTKDLHMRDTRTENKTIPHRLWTLIRTMRGVDKTEVAKGVSDSALSQH